MTQGIFSNFDQVLQSFALGKVQMHDWIWVRWRSGVHTDNPEPLQMLLSRSGQVRTVYKTYIMEHSVLETTTNHATEFVTVPDMTSAISLFILLNIEGGFKS